MTDSAASLDHADPRWRSDLVSFATARTGLPEPRVAQIVNICAAEVAVGLALIETSLEKEMRILEVGAGIGLLAHILKRRGYDIVALEPGANGFGDSALVGAALKEFIGGSSLPVLDREASGLDPAIDGVFDVIFSINVLEHIPDLEANIAAMAAVLAPGGTMLHTCPNYNVPYEPHYAIPLVPAFPHAVALLCPKLLEDELWRSLNFITSGRVRKIARSLGFQIIFQRGVLYQALKRVETDPVFSARHPGMFLTIYRFLAQSGLIQLLRGLPPSLATPMVFSMKRHEGRARR